MQDHESMPSQQPTQPPRRTRSLPIAAIASLSAIALLAGGGTAWWTWHSLSPKPTNNSISTQAPTAVSPSPITQAPAEQTVQIYWLKTVDNKIEPVPSPITVAASSQPNQILKAAFDKMLAGSSDPKLTSTIPAGTQLRSIDVKDDGVHLNLSQEFTSGGGSTSMMGRLGQVVYTATTLDPEANVWISVEGKPLEVLGGEGIMVDQPMTRENFKQNFEL